jgi:hypothetical protein
MAERRNAHVHLLLMTATVLRATVVAAATANRRLMHLYLHVAEQRRGLAPRASPKRRQLECEPAPPRSRAVERRDVRSPAPQPAAEVQLVEVAAGRLRVRQTTLVAVMLVAVHPMAAVAVVVVVVVAAVAVQRTVAVAAASLVASSVAGATVDAVVLVAAVLELLSAAAAQATAS